MKKSKQTDLQSLLTSPEVQAIIAETVKKSVTEAIETVPPPDETEGGGTTPHKKRKKKGRGQGEGSVSQRADGTWWARVTLGYDQDGKQKRKAVYGKTKREVIDKLTEMQDEINKGTFVDPTNVTVGEWLLVWLEDYKKRNVRNSTFVSYRGCVNVRIIPALGNIKLKDLKSIQVQRFINAMDDEGLAYLYILGVINTLKQALQQAVDNGMLKQNPVTKKVQLPKTEKRKRRVLTPEEQKIFIATARELHEMGYTGMDVPVFLLGTGLRLGEAYVKQKLKLFKTFFASPSTANTSLPQ